MPQFSSKIEPKIIIVSGLPRSGTSMMMKILESGGFPVLTDGVRIADEDNPEGYYEYERVKKLSEGDSGWLAEAEGKAGKIIVTLLPYLPLNYIYQIIFMHRNMSEILASQRKMLAHRGGDLSQIDDEKLTQLFQRHLKQINAWLNKHPAILRIDVNYNV